MRNRLSRAKKMQWLLLCMVGTLVISSHAQAADRFDPTDILEASIEQLQEAQAAGKVTAITEIMKSGKK